MARTKRTIQASPPASLTTEQETKPTGQTNDESSADKGTENTTITAESRDHDGDNMNSNSTLDKKVENEYQTQPTAEPDGEETPTYTFKPPPEFSDEQIKYKVLKIQSMFGYLSMDETHRMLDDCYYNEDEVTLRLITQQDYLSNIQTMLKTPNLCPTSNANTPLPSTCSEKSTPTNQQPVPSFLLSQKDPYAIPLLSPQHDNGYQLPSLFNDIHSYHQDQDLTASVSPSQLCYQTQHPYYRPLQPLTTSFPTSPPLQPPVTSPAPAPPPSSDPPPLSSTTTITTAATKRRSNYGKKYKKRKTTSPLPPPPLPSMDDYGSIPPTPIPSASELPLEETQEKRRIRTVGRLALDDALKQVKQHPMEQQQAYEGWSAARIRAYGLIDTNPNTYYYRFNAPGEEQRKGAWTQIEKELFLKRVNEVGANSQWGIFSQAIPGRVGYQCSNFYRLLIETGELFDDNYVVDDKGKAHYLFDKKTATGEIQKTIRNHYKHKKNRDMIAADLATSSSYSAAATSTSKKSKAAKKKRSKKRNPWDTDDDDDDDGEYTGKPSKAKAGTRRSTRRSTYE